MHAPVCYSFLGTHPSHMHITCTPPQVVLDICKSLDYRKVPAGTVLFRQGDKDRRFFIIFSGLVDIHVLQTNERSEFKRNAPTPWDESDDEETRIKAAGPATLTDGMTPEELEALFGMR